MVRISGKQFVIPFAVVLCVLLGLMLSVAFRFQSVMKQLEEVRSLWPMASAALSDRYSEIDAAIASNATLSEDIKTEWKKAYADFQDSSRYDQQNPVAMNLEQWVATHSKDVKDISPSKDSIASVPALSKLIEADVKRGQLQEGFIGNLTVSALRLKLPPVFSVAKNP